MSTRKPRRAREKPAPAAPTIEINIIANIESMRVGAPTRRGARGEWKEWLSVVGAFVAIATFVAPDLGVRAHESAVAFVARHIDTSTYDSVVSGLQPDGTVIPYGRSAKPTRQL